jgi:myo-inositol-1(or 4)-monophosphatase
MPPTRPELETLLQFAATLADAARPVALAHFRVATPVTNKLETGFDPVTEADRGAERAMRALITEHFPDHAIDGEEDGLTGGNGPWTWRLDPIDGTRAFISGLPTWGVLIGLCHHDRPVVGCMDQPFTGERFLGWSAGGTGQTHWIRGSEHRVLTARACAALSSATVCTTDPALFAGDERAGWETVRARARLTRLGLDCYAYAMVAAGHVDAVVESGLAPHDIAALIPIIEGAGGRVTGWDGQSAPGRGQVIACGDPALTGQIAACLGMPAN